LQRGALHVAIDDAVPKRSRAAVGQRGHATDFTAEAADGDCAEAFEIADSRRVA